MNFRKDENIKTVPSFCRNCTAYCPILVSVKNGKAIKVTGDLDAPAYEGYTCPKGRDLPEQHNHPDRPLHCLSRDHHGSHKPISSHQLMDEVAQKIQSIIERHGPRSVAVYYGTGNVTNPAGSAMARAWMKAIGTDLLFSAMSIDKPAANVSIALHGNWNAGARPMEKCKVWLIVGANPVIAKSNGAPMNNPAQRLKDAVERGTQLIVIDPRKTETAKRASFHIQPKPGYDALLLAGMIHIILKENLFEKDFINENAIGLTELRTAVSLITPDYVAKLAGIDADQFIASARAFGSAQESGVICGTGASFTPHSNLTFYLGLCLNTLCGGWVKEGEDAPYPNVLLPSFTPRAQAYAPYSVFGKGQLTASGLKESVAGYPTAALAEEILQGQGDNGIKALVCLGGNPVLSWPDQHKTELALKSLDLLVVMDLNYTATAKLADYFVAAPHQLETAASTSRVEALKYVGVARGFTIPWAQYTSKVVDPPLGSDLVEDAHFFFGLAQRMGVELEWNNHAGYRDHVESPPSKIIFDMSIIPTNEELVELTCLNSRIPLDEVKKYQHGHIFTEVATRVQGREPSCNHQLQIGDPSMMAELSSLLNQPVPNLNLIHTHLLIPRRINGVMNSVGHHVAYSLAEDRITPAFLHPNDMSQLDLKNKDLAEIQSKNGTMVVRLNSDESIRSGLISVIHGFGDLLSNNSTNKGDSVTKLIGMDEADPISAIPRMSAIPVAIIKLSE